MASANLNIIGLYNWCADRGEEDLFSGLTVPETIDLEALEAKILLEAAPFEILYPDPGELRQNIGIWSAASQLKWARWANAWEQSKAFNPLENFDRQEDEEIQHSGTDTSEGTETRALTGSNNRTLNLSDSETRNFVDERKVSAYDSSTYSPKEQETHTGSGSQGHTGTDNVASSEGGTVGNEGSFTYGHKEKRTARFHGNIGVTSLAQLLTSYNAAVEQWDLITKIAHDFINEFCVMVY